ncbi:ATP-binding protein [Candidatus Bathyarchaeota archaeon]|nr:ATP-binding protein [Candidatus Bathyarchaeota archaeon]
MEVSAEERLHEIFSIEKYRLRLSQLAVTGGRSIQVDFEDIIRFDPELAKMLVEKPDVYLRALERAALDQLRIEAPEYAEEIGGIRVRLQRLPENLKVSLRRLGAKHINRLVRVEGIIVRSSPVKPLVVKAAFRCKSCEHVQYIMQTGMLMRAPSICEACKKRGPFEFVESESEFIDYQELRVQEKPEDLPPGQLPRWLNIRVYDELVDVARPGDTVAITGIVRAVQESIPRTGKLRTFTITLEVNNLEVYGKTPETIEITPEEERLILELSKRSDIHEIIKRSIAPSIYGYDDIKEAIMYLLFGGTPKVLPDGTRIRGDINVLLVGDPGVGKSQMLRYVQRIAPRGLYTHGRGTTAAGLCVDGESLLYTDRGVLRIKDLVEEELSKGELELSKGVWVSAAPNPVKVCTLEGATRMDKATAFYRIKASELVTIKTRMGKAITTTPETRILCYEDGEFRWLRADEIERGRLLVHILNLPEVEEEPPLILDYLDDDVFCECSPDFLEKLLRGLKAKFGTLRRAAKILGIHENKLYYSWRRGKQRPRLGELRRIAHHLNLDEAELAEGISGYSYKSYRGREFIRLPRYLNEEFMKLLGYVYADGEIVRDKRRRKAFTIGYFTGRREDAEKFRKLVKNIFGIEVKVERDPRERCHSVRFSNWVVAKLLARLGMPIGRKHLRLRISREISKLPRRLLASFLQGLFTGDGGVYGMKCVCFATSTKAFAEEVRIILLRFGVMSNIAVKPPRKVKTRDGKTINSGELYEVCIYDKESLQNYREEIGFDDDEKMEKLDRLISLKRGHRNYKVREGFILLPVIEVERRRGDFTVYDLTVENTHCFVANGFIVHNTAAVLRERGGGMVLEAGALVLADQGVCAIDEIDKMRPEDRVGMHEAMSQQSISVAKGGIVATLNARAAILAAANPALGRYDPNRTVAENINLPVTLLSRFDLIFVLKDRPDKERDAKLTEHILRLHGGFEEEVKPVIEPELLRKYISYSKRIKPRMTEEAMEIIKDFYLKMRSAGELADSPIAITARQLESVIRLAEARARVALREEVTAEDAKAAVRLMRASLEQVGIDMATGKIDIDIIMTGKPKSLRDKLQAVIGVIVDLSRQMGMAEEEAVYEVLERDYGISRSEAVSLIEQLRRDGTIYSPRHGFLKKT